MLSLQRAVNMKILNEMLTFFKQQPCCDVKHTARHPATDARSSRGLYRIHGAVQTPSRLLSEHFYHHKESPPHPPVTPTPPQPPPTSGLRSVSGLSCSAPSCKRSCHVPPFVSGSCHHAPCFQDSSVGCLYVFPFYGCVIQPVGRVRGLHSWGLHQPQMENISFAGRLRLC